MKKLILLLLPIVIFAYSCKDEEKANATFELRLTDAPADYDAVNLDVVGVSVHFSTGEEEGNWYELDIEPMTTNLLEFNNGIDTLLAKTELPAGTLSQMRLLLGENSNLVVNGEEFDLKIPSGTSSGYKFNIHAQLEAGVTYTLWIDFDAARSIVVTGDAQYILKPTIRTFTEATSGAISGYIAPAEAMPHVMATNGTDSIGTIANDAGEFLLKGVPEGNYKVEFTPADGFDAQTIENIQVVLGEVAAMDTVYFTESVVR